MRRLIPICVICSLWLSFYGCQVAPAPVDFTPVTVEGIQPPDPLDGPPVVTAQAWAIIDGKTGNVLWHCNGNEPRKAASTTKIMNVYLILQLVKKDPSILDEIVEVSELAGNTGGSTAQLEAGDRVKVAELLYGFMLPSGNDAGNAFAEHFNDRFAKPAPGDPEYYEKFEGDTRQNFIAQMNRQGCALGLTNTYYRSPYGDGGTAEEFTTTAVDLSRLARHAFKLPRFRQIVQTRKFTGTLQNAEGTLRQVTWTNTNQLLNIEGYDGVKTGTTNSAGNCLVAHGRRGQDSLFITVLGSTHNDFRFIDARNLFRWAWLQRGHRQP